jgi:SAM-dependent methyltransferase
VVTRPRGREVLRGGVQSNTTGVTPRPALIAFPQNYDLIFVGSLITHLPIDAVSELLDALARVLQPGGLLIFSTQGETCLEHLDWYGNDFARAERWFRTHLDQDGHCFMSYRGQRGYGVALHVRDFIERHMRERHPFLRLLRFSERGWDRHQDVWSYQRPEVAEGATTLAAREL